MSKEDRRDLELLRKQVASSFVAAGAEAAEITVLLFTSFVPSHPQSFMIEKVYNSIHSQLPSARIVVLADGCDGQEPSRYAEFKADIRQKEWEMLEFQVKSHQSLMLRHVLLTSEFVKTPLVMVCEHDWGLEPRYIDWGGIVKVLLDPRSAVSLIQLRQAGIGEWEWNSYFFNDVMTRYGISLLPTTNFQCPTHIARTDWYRQLAPFLTVPDFLERAELENALKATGGINKMAAYIPAGPMRRTYHLDGRNLLTSEQMTGHGEKWAANPID